MPFSIVDPYYVDPASPAGWVRQQAEARHGITVHVSEHLESPGYTSADGRTVIARPGLSFPTFHWIVACSVIASVFGFEATPDLPPAPSAPERTVAYRNGIVVPLRRHG